MPGNDSDSRVRVVVNGRVLGEKASPFARLGAVEFLRQLAASQQLDPVLVVPANVPLPQGVDLPHRALSRADGALTEAAFDHWYFPQEARRLAAKVILCLHASAPLSAPAPTVALYGDGEDLSVSGFPRRRWAQALALGGLRGATAVLRFQDVPCDRQPLRWVELAPIVPLTFEPQPSAGDRQVARRLGLPEAYALLAGETRRTLRSLLAAWTWVEGPIGDSYSLLLASVGDSMARLAAEVANGLGVGGSLRTARLADEDWASVLRGASVVLHGGGRQNAALLRWAMASGVPVAALSTPVTESVLGVAGYLASEGDTRGLGAACLTLLVDENVAGAVRERGLQRAANYRSEAARQAWVKAILDASRT